MRKCEATLPHLHGGRVAPALHGSEIAVKTDQGRSDDGERPVTGRKDSRDPTRPRLRARSSEGTGEIPGRTAVTSMRPRRRGRDGRSLKERRGNR